MDQLPGTAILRTADPTLRRVIDAIGPIAWQPSGKPLFEVLAHTVIRQQLSVSAAASIERRFASLFRGRFPSPAKFLSLSPDDCRQAGLSRPKTAYIQGIAQRCLAGQIPSFSKMLKLRDDAIFEILRSCKGLGQWSVEMILIFELNRPDVFPFDDVAIQRAFSRWYGPIKPSKLPAAMAKTSQRWAPYRTTAARYLWRSLSLSEPVP